MDVTKILAELKAEPRTDRRSDSKPGAAGAGTWTGPWKAACLDVGDDCETPGPAARSKNKVAANNPAPKGAAVA